MFAGGRGGGPGTRHQTNARNQHRTPGWAPDTSQMQGTNIGHQAGHQTPDKCKEPTSDTRLGT